MKAKVRRKKTSIAQVQGREILDSRGHPTIRTKVTLHGGAVGIASVPSGASTGTHEALELRDGDPGRYFGKGVLKAVANVNEVIAPEVVGMDALKQRKLDDRLIELDGTPAKNKLGANAILSVSMAAASAASAALNIPLYDHLGKKEALILPVPLVNILNGGTHADNNLNIQEFLIAPAGSPSFEEAIRKAAEVFHNLKKLLKKKGYSTAVGDEGGFAPNLRADEEALDLIMESIVQAGYRAGDDIFLALDVAASELFEERMYVFKKSDRSRRSSDEMIDLYERLVRAYPIISIEDGLAEDDWTGWAALTARLGKKIQLIGDDIFVTNIHRLKDGIRKGIANSILIKLNQIGTLTETIETVSCAQGQGYSTVISHRSGETEDTFIADLSVALNTGQIKTGSVSRSERVAKYNRLLEIEEELKDRGSFAGKKVFAPYIA
ncbi:MAG: phosphopyruvate hydratase [Clostridiales bacterium]|nr:phosphopyruvate hydratase [Clostridiales bacterium]